MQRMQWLTSFIDAAKIALLPPYFLVINYALYASVDYLFYFAFYVRYPKLLLYAMYGLLDSEMTNVMRFVYYFALHCFRYDEKVVAVDIFIKNSTFQVKPITFAIFQYFQNCLYKTVFLLSNPDSR